MGPIWSRINYKLPPHQRPPPRHHDEWRPQEVWAPFLLGQTPVNNYSNQVNPWLHPTDSRLRCDIAHHSRTFIEGQSTSRDEGTMTDQDLTAREIEEPGVTQDDVTQEEEAEFNDRGEDKDKQN